MKNPILYCCWNSAEMIEALKEDCKKLEDRREHLILQIDAARRNGHSVNKEADIWLQKSNKVLEEMKQVQVEDKRSYAGICATNFVAKNTNKKKKLISMSQMAADLNGHFFDILMLPTLEEVKEVSSKLLEESMEADRPTVAQNSIVSDICKCLRDEGGPSTFGILGSRGSGKTFILKKVHQKLLEEAASCDFKVIIFCHVGQEPDINKIQDEIRARLGIMYHLWKNKSLNERTNHIHTILSQVKFVLLLDDVWGTFSLRQLGVPTPQESQKESKVVFTSRSKSSFDSMDTRVVKEFVVEPMTPLQAWGLFSKIVKEEIVESSPGITELAKEIVVRCQGLPFAIITIAHALSGNQDIHAWQDVLSRFRQSSLSTEDVQSFLKISYDYREDIEKSCLKYSCLLPDMHRDELVDHLVGKGILDGKESRSQGHKIIDNLSRARLLMVEENLVTLHDMVRDFCLNILYTEQKEKHIVRIGRSLTEAHEVGEWQDASGVSLAENHIEELPGLPFCPKLSTLILTNSGLETLSNEFFENTPSLRVLDLSWCKIYEIPVSIAVLEGLQYLNLSYTNVTSLPVELRELVKLRVLILNNMRELDVIPRGMFLRLICLQVLDVYRCGTLDLIDRYSNGLLVGSEEFIDEVENLVKLNYLGISIKDVKGMERFAQSRKMQSSTHCLSIMIREDLTILDLHSLKFMVHLSFLEICNCEDLVRVRIQEHMVSDWRFYGLQHVRITRCWSLRELTWLTFAPNLKTLLITRCMSLEVIIGGENNLSEVDFVEFSCSFSNLTRLYLADLPKLMEISYTPVSFPVLEELYVSNCPSLRQLPIDPTSIPKTLKLIEGERDWWDDLPLEDAVKQSLNFKEIKE